MTSDQKLNCSIFFLLFDLILWKDWKYFFFSPSGGARDPNKKLQPFDSESKTSSDCGNSWFSFYQSLRPKNSVFGI